jgi:S-formylglutathione hydrolase FrmB
MTLRFRRPDHAPGTKLPVLWYLSGLTCTHANVMEKGEYRAACAEHGVIFIAPIPARAGASPTIPTQPMISVWARDSCRCDGRSVGEELSDAQLCRG